WISGRSFSASGDVRGPRVAIRLGLNTGAKESPISFSATSSGSASAPAGWLRTATSTPSVLKLAFPVHEETCVLIFGKAFVNRCSGGASHFEVKPGGALMTKVLGPRNLLKL